MSTLTAIAGPGICLLMVVTALREPSALIQSRRKQSVIFLGQS